MMNHAKEREEEEDTHKQLQCIVKLFSEDDKAINEILKKTGFGQRLQLEGSDDFHL